jgi:hypothetical protein
MPARRSREAAAKRDSPCMIFRTLPGGIALSLRRGYSAAAPALAAALGAVVLTGVALIPFVATVVASS